MFIRNRFFEKVLKFAFYAFIYLFVFYLFFYVIYLVASAFGIRSLDEPIFLNATHLFGFSMILCLIVFFIHAVLKVRADFRKKVSRYEKLKSLYFLVFFHGLYGFYLVFKQLDSED